jgi:DNA-binding PadR family transcriptional regulator
MGFLDMAFEYAWLKILQVLTNARRAMSVEELRGTMEAGGFHFGSGAFEAALNRLRDQELIEALVLAGGDTDTVGSVAITAKGERKVRGIVRL